MKDVVVGLVAILVGLAFCLRGYVAMRIIIPLWASVAGFFLGAGIVAGVDDDGFLRTAGAWLVGLAVGVVFGLIAYLYYEVSVIIALASVGFVLGASLMTALGVEWSWLVVLVGVLAGTLLAAVAIITDLPAILLVVLTALGGASLAVGGLMLLVGTLDGDDLATVTTTERIDDDWWWYALYVVLALVGIAAQARVLDRLRASTRAQWLDAGGRTMAG